MDSRSFSAPYTLVCSSTPKGCSIEDMKEVFRKYGKLHGEGIRLSTTKKDSKFYVDYEVVGCVIKAYKALGGKVCPSLDPTCKLSIQYSKETRMKLASLGLLEETVRIVMPKRMPSGPGRLSELKSHAPRSFDPQNSPDATQMGALKSNVKSGCLVPQAAGPARSTEPNASVTAGHNRIKDSGFYDHPGAHESSPEESDLREFRETAETAKPRSKPSTGTCSFPCDERGSLSFTSHGPAALKTDRNLEFHILDAKGQGNRESGDSVLNESSSSTPSTLPSCVAPDKAPSTNMSGAESNRGLPGCEGSTISNAAHVPQTHSSQNGMAPRRRAGAYSENKKPGSWTSITAAVICEEIEKSSDCEVSRGSTFPEKTESTVFPDSSIEDGAVKMLESRLLENTRSSERSDLGCNLAEKPRAGGTCVSKPFAGSCVENSRATKKISMVAKSRLVKKSVYSDVKLRRRSLKCSGPGIRKLDDGEACVFDLLSGTNKTTTESSNKFLEGITPQEFQDWIVEAQEAMAVDSGSFNIVHSPYPLKISLLSVNDCFFQKSSYCYPPLVVPSLDDMCAMQCRD